MKIRIIGSCGSGKSTLAKKLSEKYDIPYDEIDNIIWDRSSDNLKYPEETRDATLKSIDGSNSWILERVQYKDWMLESIEQADIVLVLNPHVFIRDYRIIIIRSYDKTPVTVKNASEAIDRIEEYLRANQTGVKWIPLNQLHQVKLVPNMADRIIEYAKTRRNIELIEDLKHRD